MTTSVTRTRLGWFFQASKFVTHPEMIVEAKDSHGATTTYLFSLNTDAKDWPNSYSALQKLRFSRGDGSSGRRAPSPPPVPTRSNPQRPSGGGGSSGSSDRRGPVTTARPHPLPDHRQHGRCHGGRARR